MLIVLSPAKSLDLDTPSPTQHATTARFIDHATELAAHLKTLSPPQVSELMSISDALAVLNVTRYADWHPDHAGAPQAVMAFDGDVYTALDARSLDGDALGWLQRRVRILSGMYGVLRPFDRMHPYRLEMGTRLANARGKDLYAFWGDTVTGALNADIAELAELTEAGQGAAVVNLASEEYFKSVRPALLDAPVITPVFEDWKDGRYKTMSFHAKRARGLMARYAAQQGITDPQQLKDFDLDGYAFDQAVSSDSKWLFRRRREV